MKTKHLIKENKRYQNKNYLFLICIFLLSFLSCSTFKSRIEKNKQDFYIGFDGCFDEDQIVVKFNDFEVFNSTNISSNIYTRSAELYFQYYENSKKQGVLVIQSKTDRREIDLFLDYKNNLTLEVIRNGNLAKFNLDFKQGNRILIDGCDSENKSTLISYYKKKIIR